MREIKFRALTEDGMITVHGLRRLAESYDVDDGAYKSYVIELNKLMQFTGLHDKNGKEIYEGDVLDWGDNFNSVVYWDDYEGAWRIREVAIVTERGENRPRTHDMNAYTYRPTVLGNQYENPDLIAQM